MMVDGGIMGTLVDLKGKKKVQVKGLRENGHERV